MADKKVSETFFEFVVSYSSETNDTASEKNNAANCSGNSGTDDCFFRYNNYSCHNKFLLVTADYT